MVGTPSVIRSWFCQPELNLFIQFVYREIHEGEGDGFFVSFVVLTKRLKGFFGADVEGVLVDGRGGVDGVLEIVLMDDVEFESVFSRR